MRTVPSPAAEGLRSARYSAFIQLLPLLGVLLVAATLLAPKGLNGDEGPIIAAAHRLLQGRYAVIGTMDATRFLWHGPGLPALLSPLVAVGTPLSGLRLTSPLLMFAAALLFYRLLRLNLSHRASVIGAYALGLYGPAYYVLGTVAKEPLALLLAISVLYGAARYLRHGSTRHAVLAGLSLGALVMTRLEYGWIVAIALCGACLWWAVAWLLRGRQAEPVRIARACALICGIGMLACVPWLIYTYALTGRPFYWGNSGGLSLYWMSSPSPSQLGQWHAPHTVLTSPSLVGYRPFFRHLATLPPVKRDLALQHAAVVQAVGHPAKYALNLLANLGRMFLGFPFSFTLSLAVIVGLILFNGTLLAGLLAAARSLRRHRLPLPRETVPFLAFGALIFALHILPTSEPRMILPAIPIAIWLIWQALGRRQPGWLTSAA